MEEWQIIRVDVEQTGRRIERVPDQLAPPNSPGIAIEPLKLGGRNAGPCGFCAIGRGPTLGLLCRCPSHLSRQRTGRRKGAASPGWAAFASLFAGDIRGGHGPFLDGKERLPCLAIKQVDVARFCDLGNGVNLLATASDGHQVRIHGQIVIPQVVMERLEMPDACRPSWH